MKHELFVTHMIYNRMKAYIKQTDHPDEKDEMFKVTFEKHWLTHVHQAISIEIKTNSNLFSPNYGSPQYDNYYGNWPNLFKSFEGTTIFCL